MPGANNGTGQPLSFVCAKLRATGHAGFSEARIRAEPYHQTVERTGRVRKRRGRSGARRLSKVEVEYRCECGHVGWTGHSDILRNQIQGPKVEDRWPQEVPI